MSFAYLPLYTGDYLRDTRHLSMAEHGAYLLMLTYCWDQKGPLPLDRHRIQGICNARSKDEQEAVERVLADFFVVMDDGLYNKRMQAEIERCDNISRERSEAGKKGYEARAKHLPSKRRAIAKQVHLSPSPSLSLSPTSAPEESKGGSTKVSPDLSPIVESLPLRDGRPFPIRQSVVSEFEVAYPRVDVSATLKEMRAWLIANPDRRKTYRGCLRFVNTWLANAQREYEERVDG